MECRGVASGPSYPLGRTQRMWEPHSALCIPIQFSILRQKLGKEFKACGDSVIHVSNAPGFGLALLAKEGVRQEHGVLGVTHGCLRGIDSPAASNESVFLVLFTGASSCALDAVRFRKRRMVPRLFSIGRGIGYRRS
jgi:hypothetical protein